MGTAAITDGTAWRANLDYGLNEAPSSVENHTTHDV